MMVDFRFYEREKKTLFSQRNQKIQLIHLNKTQFEQVHTI